MIQVNGVALNVQRSGSDTGIPLIWGHGLTSSMAGDDTSPWLQWAQLADDIRLVRYDARGHGQSEASAALADYHWSALARDMLALADQVGYTSFVAGGQSMGCATSLYAALAAPERIRGLVLMNVPTAWATRAAQTAFYGQMADVIAAQGVEALIALQEQLQASMPANWQMSVFPEAAASYANSLRAHDPQALITTLRAAQSTDLPAPAELAAIRAPALILAWTDDPGHPVSSAEVVAQQLPNARLLIAHNAAEAATWTDEVRAFVTHLA